MKDPVHSFKSVDYKNIQDLKDSLVTIYQFGFYKQESNLKMDETGCIRFHDIDNRETAALKRQTLQ